jgi:hypothetical protein
MSPPGNGPTTDGGVRGVITPAQPVTGQVNPAPGTQASEDRLPERREL